MSWYCGNMPNDTDPPFLLSLCPDEMKDDFDTLGPDGTLQTVGNGTGEPVSHDFLALSSCLFSLCMTFVPVSLVRFCKLCCNIYFDFCSGSLAKSM